MGDRATILAKQIETTRERLAGVAAGESTMSQTVSNIETARHELDDFLKTTEGEEDLTELETDEDNNDLDDVFSEIDDLSDFEDRVKALENLAPKIGPLRSALAGLKTRLGQLENLSIDKELEKLEKTREKVEGMLDELEGDDSVNTLEELETVKADFAERIETFKAAIAGT